MRRGPPGRLWPIVCAGAMAAGAALWVLIGPGAPAVGAEAPAVSLTAAQVSALHGHLQTWQVLWLESGGASGVLPGASAAAPQTPDPADASYLLNGAAVTLSNGTATGPLTPGSDYVVTTRVVGPTVHGQLAGDGLIDTVTVLGQGWAGGGTAEYVAALLAGPQPGPAPTALLGDDLDVGWLRVLPGEILADSVAAPAGGPAGAETVQAFVLQDGALVPSPSPLTTVQTTWTPAAFRPQETENGSCPSASAVAVRAGAFRCMADGGMFDPCFASAGGPPAVACPQGDPAAESGVQIDLTAPLPEAAAAAAGAGRPAPWSFSVLGGGVCEAAAGQPAFPGYPYDCSLPGAASAGSGSGAVVFCAPPHRVNAELDTTECAAPTAPASGGGGETLGPDVPYVIAEAWF